ncbi:MAG: PSD1 and planctomycete cytochrome C domain-containing protein [Planctomycetales bacterium]
MTDDYSQAQVVNVLAENDDPVASARGLSHSAAMGGYPRTTTGRDNDRSIPLRAIAAALLGLLLLCRVAAAAEPVDYLREIKPILKARCFACHGALKQQSGLRLDAGTLIRQGGDSGAVVVPGKPDESLLLERVAAEGASERMPPEGEPLKPEQIEQLKAWISQGATSPEDEQPEPDPRRHWAFQPPVRPPVPQTADSTSRNPIDAFIAQEQSRARLGGQPPAEKQELLRRVYFDLIGLPPARDELHAFLADDSPDAYARLVDRLLESPQYGERWGRHWMDVWRYSDWYGRRIVPDVMNSYPLVWRWRDWIVRSLNADKGYDQMVVEMLAGDEIAPQDPETVVATGFIVRNWFKWNYDTWMRDQVEHTGKAFLGLWLQCSLCHDHKYDPISQHEYFQFRAVFEPLELRHDRIDTEADPGPFKKYIYGQSYGPITTGLVRVFDEKPQAQTRVYRGGDQRNIIEGLPLMPPGVPHFLSQQPLEIHRTPLPLETWYPGLRPSAQKEEREKRRSACAAAETVLAAAKTLHQEKLPVLQEAVTKAEANLAAAIAAETAAGSLSAPLDGTQSLLLDAATGRRVLVNALPGVPEITGEAELSFTVRLFSDAHFNVQLALDVTTGATGGWVGFEAGQILTYKPGGFEQVRAGTYDLSKGPVTLHVTLRLDVAQDQCLLTVEQSAMPLKLVDQLPAALNGWRGRRDGKQGLWIDARPGTVALIDALRFQPPTGEPWLAIDLEPEKYPLGRDVAGVQGWSVQGSSLPPATSRVVRSVPASAAARGAEQETLLAQRALEASLLAVHAAQAKQQAAQGELDAFEARLAAELSRHVTQSSDAEGLAQAAAAAERRATHLAAVAASAQSAWGLAQAEALPISDAKRGEMIDKAAAGDAAARMAASAAEAALQKTDATFSPLGPTYPRESTGRRTALAQWIVARQNPLAARVAVNHLWNWHLGRPLVETVSNFGRNGKPPTHPELLDWLAVEFMEQGWSQKHLHRLILNSDVYRQSSHAPTGHPGFQKDPDNRLLWRAHLKRLEAEMVRDTVLYVAGELDPTPGGAELDQALGLTSRRRSLYFAHHGEAGMQFLELFDAPSTLDCYQRTASILPQQALALSNSELTRLQARRLASKLTQEQPAQFDNLQADRWFVVAAFEQVLSRPPDPMELTASLEFLSRQRALYAEGAGTAGPTAAAPEAAPPAPVDRSRESLIQALLNHNDFLTIR